MDSARYADTTGDRQNNRRNDYRFPYAWTYRDYVVRAFNEDKPYDQFIREQIAGDLLPADSAEAKRRKPSASTVRVLSFSLTTVSPGLGALSPSRPRLTSARGPWRSRRTPKCRASPSQVVSLTGIESLEAARRPSAAYCVFEESIGSVELNAEG